MNEQKTTEHAAEVIRALQEEYKEGVIKDYQMPPLVNMKTGKTIGFAVVMQVAGKYDYSDSMLNEWKEKFGADDYSISVKRSQLWVTFRVRDFVPTEGHIRRMTHAIGLDNKQPDQGCYEAYRNGSFYDEPVREWDELELAGYAYSRRKEKDCRYFVSPKGFQLLADHHKLMIRFTNEYEGRE